MSIRGNKYVIFYSAWIPNLDTNADSRRVFSDLYYSLKTFYDKHKSNKIDIVCYISSTIDLYDYYFKEVYNLLRDFPNVDFIDFNYDGKHYAMHKWIATEDIFKVCNYEIAMYLDNDTYFLNDPIDIFEEHTDDYFYVKMDVSDALQNIYEKVIGKNSLNSGQFLFNRKIYNLLGDNLFTKLVDRRNRISYDASKKISFDSWLVFSKMEQHTMSVFLDENDIPTKELNKSMFLMGGQLDDTVDEADIIIHHYFNYNKNVFVPSKFWDRETINLDRKKNPK